MKIWQNLYSIIWLMFFSIMLQSKAIDFPYVEYVHMALGAGVLGLAFLNYSNVSKTEAPARTKRILKAIVSLSTIMMFLGVFIFILSPEITNIDDSFGICQIGFSRLFHLTLAITIITQAASAATSYDMWEEKEFLPPAKPEEAGEEPQ